MICFGKTPYDDTVSFRKMNARRGANPVGAFHEHLPLELEVEDLPHQLFSSRLVR